MLKAYRGKQYEHTHENSIFDKLYDILHIHCSKCDEEWYLIGSFFVGNREIDAAVIKDNAIVLIDFKNYAGKLTFSENEPWIIETKDNGRIEVKGGASENPYCQLLKNKNEMVAFMEKQFGDTKNNWRHIATLVCFHGGIVEYNDNEIPSKSRNWFHICNIDTIARKLDEIVSNRIKLGKEFRDKIIKNLNVSEFKPVNQEEIRIIDKFVKDKHTPSESQKIAIAKFSDWLDKLDGNKQAFRLLGMAGTGKKFLLCFFIPIIQKKHYTPYILARSRRVATKYKHYLDPDCIHYVYSELYNKNKKEIISNNGKKIVKFSIKDNFPATTNKDEDDCSSKRIENPLIIILDAHLWSNDSFDSDFRYGSGHLIKDLLKTAKETPFLIIGDPYQIIYGEKSDSLVMNEISIFDGEVVTYELNEQFNPHSAKSKLLYHLQQSISHNKFSSLPKFYDNDLQIINDKEIKARDIIKEQNLRLDFVYLADSHTKVNAINDDFKNNVLNNVLDNISIGAGIRDKVDFYNQTFSYDSDDTTEGIYIPAGSLGIVKGLYEIEEYPIKLSGRNYVTSLQFQTIRCDICDIYGLIHKDRNIKYLINFYNTPKPELDEDVEIALNIFATNKHKEKIKPLENKRDSDIKELKDKYVKDTEEFKKEKKRIQEECEKEKFDIIQKEDIELLKNKRDSDIKELKEKHLKNTEEFKKEKKRIQEECEKEKFDIIQKEKMRIAKIRPAFAMTVHRAQGSYRDNAYLDATTIIGSYNNSGYFRWLYTANCISKTLQILHYNQFDALLKAEIKRDSKFSIGSIQVKNVIQYDLNYQFTDDDKQLVPPDGFSDEKLAPLLIAICKKLTDSNWNIDKWKEHQNQVSIDVVNTDKMKITLHIYYKKDLSVSNVLFSPKCDELRDILCGGFVIKDSNLNEALQCILNRLDSFKLICGKEDKFKANLILYKDDESIDIDMYINKDAEITTIIIKKATSDLIVNDFESVFKN